jgi:hypothetical protein
VPETPRVDSISRRMMSRAGPADGPVQPPVRSPGRCPAGSFESPISARQVPRPIQPRRSARSDSL